MCSIVVYCYVQYFTTKYAPSVYCSLCVLNKPADVLRTLVSTQCVYTLPTLVCIVTSQLCVI